MASCPGRSCCSCSRSWLSGADGRWPRRNNASLASEAERGLEGRFAELEMAHSERIGVGQDQSPRNRALIPAQRTCDHHVSFGMKLHCVEDLCCLQRTCPSLAANESAGSILASKILEARPIMPTVVRCRSSAQSHVALWWLKAAPSLENYPRQWRRMRYSR